MAEFYKSRVGENNQLEIHYFLSRVSFSIHKSIIYTKWKLVL